MNDGNKKPNRAKYLLILPIICAILAITAPEWLPEPTKGHLPQYLVQGGLLFFGALALSGWYYGEG